MLNWCFSFRADPDWIVMIPLYKHKVTVSTLCHCVNLTKTFFLSWKWRHSLFPYQRQKYNIVLIIFAPTLQNIAQLVFFFFFLTTVGIKVMGRSPKQWIFKEEAVTWAPWSLLPFVFSLARVAEFNSLSLLTLYSSIADILKCEDFGTKSNECCSNKACNQMFVLFTWEMRDKGRIQDLSKTEMTG